MKTQAVVVLAALFLLTNFVTDSHGFGGTMPGKKRELERKVERGANNLPEVKGSRGMERSEFDNYKEEKGK